MQITLPTGTYVVAISGGVDSMVLLDLLATQHAAKTDKSPRLIVAHFDHGIRHDSHLDRQLVQEMAKQHDLAFVYDRAELGVGASEAVARKARYDFLQKVRRATSAKAIITAHHQDDLLETAVINLLRGTNRRGLTALKSTSGLLRPLLDTQKQELVHYAKTNGLAWREDSTNSDPRYLRNDVRQSVLSKLDAPAREKFVALLQRMSEVNHELDTHLANYLHLQAIQKQLDRPQFILLPHAVAREVMAAWLRAHGLRTYDRKMLERLIVAAKTFVPGKVADVQNGYKLQINNKYLTLICSDR